MSTSGADSRPVHRYFAFIRAINTGTRRLTNEALIEPFRRLGFSEVAAYQAAGNVTFLASDGIEVEELAIGSALTAAYGFDAPVFVRSAAELAGLPEAQPFSPQELSGTEGRIQVSFLHTEPDPATIESVEHLIPGEDRVAFVGREWFWLPRRGVSDSQLPVPAVENLVGPMTMRTLGTVSRMLAKFI